ncbi:MAG TPA: TIGR03084 family metal-binding protein [Acidimicrobiia bacterium]|nr:TIGR03084 family metal-binding protein [Acidimicrobiia bacterium]
MSHAGWDGDPILEDLAAETASLLAEVEGLSAGEDGIDRVTPAAPWTIRDQLSHLAGFDVKARIAATDPERFVAELAADFGDRGDVLMERQFAEGRAMTPPDVLAWLRAERAALIAAFVNLDPEERIPWYGPPMKTRSSAVARLMETWAHGVDVVDALGVVREPTDRLFQVAELGVKTFRFSFQNRGLEVPESRVRVTLVGPSGTVRTWNDDSAESVTGPVEDFCLVVAQRRHVADTALEVSGPAASAWMAHAQVFAGPPGPGRKSSRTQG